MLKESFIDKSPLSIPALPAGRFDRGAGKHSVRENLKMGGEECSPLTGTICGEKIRLHENQ
jgi:hypothetical protein